MKRALVIIVVLVLAGGGYWLLQNRERFFPKPVAKEVAPQRWQVSTAKAPEPRNATLPAALNATNASTVANATAEANATLPQPPADEIVRHDFITDVSQYLVARYLPGGTTKNPAPAGRFDLNVKSVNMRYGIDFPGLNVDPVDTLASRKAVFTHVLQTPVLEFLHAAYTPLFLDSLEEALRSASHTTPSGQNVPVTDEQRAEMLSLLAARLRAVGQPMSALARTDAIRPLVKKYLEDIENVSQAHLAFWNVQGENASVAARDEASARIKTTIQTREISRQRLLQAIVGVASPQGMDASELIYLAQWIHRRSLENPGWVEATGKAGDLLVRVAAAVEERSREPRPAPGPENATGEAGQNAQ
jgi:hypothetical protein